MFQFNFVGKLLGPKGNSLKRLQEDTMCKMAVLGRGSMKDRQKVNKFITRIFNKSCKIIIRINNKKSNEKKYGFDYHRSTKSRIRAGKRKYEDIRLK